MTPLQELHRLGQSIWYDFISRDFIESGEMARLVEQGIRGMTSNPTIFEKAIGSGDSYDLQIRRMNGDGNGPNSIAEAIFVSDVTAACDVIRPVFDESDGTDGFISLEVSPTLSADTDGTVEEAERLWSRVDRPNLMIKIPATPEGIPAVRTCLGKGINVNITLIFSLEQYRAVAEAYLGALEDRLERGESIDGLSSVASVFVSRIDSMIDERLEARGTPEARSLQGKAGLANSKLVYQEFRRIFNGDRWDRLAGEGAREQRPLWASTSTKNPDYPDLLYVDNLIGPDTVNTVPPDTLEAILDHVTAAKTIEEGSAEAENILKQIEEQGVSVDEAMHDLLSEGVDKFVKSFESLFETIEQKSKALSESGEQ